LKSWPFGRLPLGFQSFLRFILGGEGEIVRMKINKIVDSHAPFFSSIVRRVVEIQANGIGWRWGRKGSGRRRSVEGDAFWMQVE